MNSFAGDVIQGCVWLVICPVLGTPKLHYIYRLGINYWKWNVIIYIHDCFRINYVRIFCQMVFGNTAIEEFLQNLFPTQSPNYRNRSGRVYRTHDVPDLWAPSTCAPVGRRRLGARLHEQNEQTSGRLKRGVRERVGIICIWLPCIGSPLCRTCNRTVTQMRHPTPCCRPWVTQLRATIACRYSVGV